MDAKDYSEMASPLQDSFDSPMNEEDEVRTPN
jgi:hypothetical protein